MDTYSYLSPSVSPFIARSLSVAGVLNITLPHSNGTSLQDEIQCYSIPYGLVGFISHLISYYTIVITALGRRPLMPWRELERKNYKLSILQLLGTMGLAIYTIYACHDRWQFVLIGVWKLAWNAVKSGWQMTAGWKVSGRYSSSRGISLSNEINHAARCGEIHKKSGNIMRGLMQFYFITSIIGLVGVASLVKLNSHKTPHILTITEAFGGAVAFVIVFGIYFVLREKEVNAFIVLPCMAVGVLFALYSDWILGAIMNNLLGNPLSNRTFYWGYFVFKHLALLMI